MGAVASAVIGFLPLGDSGSLLLADLSVVLSRCFIVGSYRAEQLGSAPVPTAQTRENTIDNALVLNASNQRDRPLVATAASKSEQIH